MSGKQNTLLILGANGHGKVAADIAVKSKKYQHILFFDDDAELKQCLQFSVVGKCEEAFRYIGLHEIFVAIGNAAVRKCFLTSLAEKKAEIATLIHPNAVLGEGVQIGMGSIVMAGAVLNPDCIIGKGCIINTCASVDHDCRIGNYVHVSVGAHIAGTVDIGDDTWIGAGAVVNNNLHITDSCMIGSGAVVVKNIQERGTYVGVPARELYMKKTEEKQVAIGHSGGVILWANELFLLLSFMGLQSRNGGQQ